MYRLSVSSETKLVTCHPDLRRIVRKALSYNVMDFSVIEGHRSLEKQQSYFNAKPPKTQIDGINKKSLHQSYPSLAVDLMPYPSNINGIDVWADAQRWCVLAGLMYAAASELNAQIRWGGDWDSDGNNADSKFNDYPHYELVMN